MAKISNLTRLDIKLETLHVIPAGGFLTVDNRVILGTDNMVHLNSMRANGLVELELDPEPEPGPMAATSIDPPEDPAHPKGDAPSPPAPVEPPADPETPGKPKKG